MKGKWRIVHPTDCFTMLPVYECSRCKYLNNGYDPGVICPKCGSKNSEDNKKSVTRTILDNVFEQNDIDKELK